jgi:hypothetical protein
MPCSDISHRGSSRAHRGGVAPSGLGTYLRQAPATADCGYSRAARSMQRRAASSDEGGDECPVYAASNPI